MSPTNLPKCRHARPVKVSHCAAVNDDVSDVCTSHRRVVFLFSTVTVLANSFAILQHVRILPCIVNSALCPGMCCINTNKVFYFVLQHVHGRGDRGELTHFSLKTIFCQHCTSLLNDVGMLVFHAIAHVS